MRLSIDGFTLEEVTNADINEDGTFIIPDSVTEIGERAFLRCTSLTNITIPDSVEDISYYAFLECTSLNNITIPDSVMQISHGAFFGCTSLTSITLPDSVTEIGYSAFDGCRRLASISIPESVTDISENTFSDCTSLNNIIINSDNEDDIARITALLPLNMQSKVVNKQAFDIAHGICQSALCRVTSELSSDLVYDKII